MQGRQTAYKVWIAEIVDAEYIREVGEWEPNYIDCKGLKVSRVNILGTVTELSTATNEYASLALDDGSATIFIRVFKEDVKLLANSAIGDILLVIGRPRQYQNEIYILPEIVKKIDNPAWVKYRKLELVQTRGQVTPKKTAQPEAQKATSENQEAVQQVQTNEQREEIISAAVTLSGSEGTRQKILDILEKQGEMGMDIDIVVQASEVDGEEAENIIEDLIKEGEIYMSRPGILKII